jgi:2'-5' RNA ligase
MSMGTIRSFIAVPIPDAVTAWLQQIQAKLRSPGRNIRWVAARNIHLTLKFLGDIDPTRIPEIAARMDAAATPVGTFRLQAKGVGAFPNLRKARVFWAGLAGDLDPLRTLQVNLETGLEAIGFAREGREFQAHLTLGRARRYLDARSLADSLEALKEAASEAFQVDRLALYQSTLKPTGAQYIRLHTARLENICGRIE